MIEQNATNEPLQDQVDGSWCYNFDKLDSATLKRKEKTYIISKQPTRTFF